MWFMCNSPPVTLSVPVHPSDLSLCFLIYCDSRGKWRCGSKRGKKKMILPFCSERWVCVMWFYYWGMCNTRAQKWSDGGVLKIDVDTVQSCQDQMIKLDPPLTSLSRTFIVFFCWINIKQMIHGEAEAFCQVM